MLTISEYSDIIENALSQIHYPAAPEGLYKPIVYALEGGGKHLRPVLLMAVADAYGVMPQSVVNQALGIEMFHNFTLLHDDVMDNADVRRGRPTVHRRWDNNTAILSGDAMLTMATQFVSQCDADKLPAVIALFNKTAMEVYEGQQYDVDYEEKDNVTVDEYIEMIRLKTAVLLACACRMGALMAGADTHKADAMYRYGEKLGLAFQLQDDFLDTYGDAALFGKAIGGDILNEKKTWLWITAMDERPDEMQSVLDKKLTDYLKIEEIRAIYDELDLPERSRAMCEHYVSEAIKALDEAGLDSDSHTFFEQLAQGASKRAN